MATARTANAIATVVFSVSIIVVKRVNSPLLLAHVMVSTALVALVSTVLKKTSSVLIAQTVSSQNVLV